MQVKTLPFMGLLVLLFNVTCIKETINPISFEILDVTNVIEEFNVGKFYYEQAEAFEGRVYMRTAADNKLIVFVHNANLGHSVLAYQLQAKDLSLQNFETTIDHAQVLFFRNSLIINAIDRNERYSLMLADAERSIVLEKDGSIIKGFGLSRMMLEDYLNSDHQFVLGDALFGDPGDTTPMIDGCTCETSLDEDNPCDSGGMGAINCSGAYGRNGTNCSVACAGDTFACCKTSKNLTNF